MSKHRKIFRDWKLILVFGVLSIILATTTIKYQVTPLKLINTISWIIFAFYLYKDIFSLINSFDLANDLVLWLLRITGGITAFIGLLFGGALFFGGIVSNSDPLSIGLSILFFGLGILGAFMVFRTRRRYGHLYINR